MQILVKNLFVVGVLLSACETTTDELTQTRENGREVCEGRHITTPAIVETVTTQTEVSPATFDENGRVVTEAVYETATQQRITEERTEIRFEAVCPSLMTPEFLSTLQRALAARNHYTADINGRYTQTTKAAIKSYQSENGLQSNILSVNAARRLGLITIDLSKN